MQLYIPNLHSFAMNNPFTGSHGMFRFRIVPKVVKAGKEVNMAESSLHAEYWHGLFCYEKSQMEGSREFPMSEEGRTAMLVWLQENI